MAKGKKARDVGEADGELWRAAKRGDAAGVAKALAMGASPNASMFGQTVACKAAECADPSCLRLLIRAGADIHGAEDSGLTPLFVAAKQGSGECMDALLRAGADPEVPDAFEARTLCMRAALGGSPECLRLAIRAGGDIHARDKHGQTPAMFAAESGSKECVLVLARAGADLDAKDGLGRTPAAHGRIGFDASMGPWVQGLAVAFGELGPIQRASSERHADAEPASPMRI